MLNSPDQDDDLKGFLNGTSQRVLQACFDKESVISLVTLSQSSHTSMDNIAMICTELEVERFLVLCQTLLCLIILRHVEMVSLIIITLHRKHLHLFMEAVLERQNQVISIFYLSLVYKCSCLTHCVIRSNNYSHSAQLVQFHKSS